MNNKIAHLLRAQHWASQVAQAGHRWSHSLTHSLTVGPAAEAGGFKSCINSHSVQPMQDGGQPCCRQPRVRSAVGAPRAEQPPCHWADELVLGAVDVGHHAVGVADEGRVIEGSFAHCAQPETRGKSR